MIVKDTVFVCEVLPLVPFRVRVYVPLGDDEVVVILNVELPEPVMVVGVNVPVVLAGTPVAVRATTPVNPPEGVIVTV